MTVFHRRIVHVCVRLFGIVLRMERITRIKASAGWVFIRVIRNIRIIRGQIFRFRNFFEHDFQLRFLGLF